VPLPSFGIRGCLSSLFFFFSFNVVFFSFIGAPYLFFGVGKKVCFILFYGFCNLARCKFGKKQGLLEKRSMLQLNCQMALELSRMKEVWKDGRCKSMCK
jgi:hypothetical protein